MASFQAEMGWEWPKKREFFFFLLGTIFTQPELENSQKNLKTLSWIHFNPKEIRTGRKIEKKFLLFGTVFTRPGLENFK